MNRRQFLATGATTAAVLAQNRPAVPLGIDLFSIRDSNYTPFEYLDYAARQGAQVVHFSEIRFLGNLEPEHLTKVREHAAKLGIQIEIGMRSICPTSTIFDASQGSAEDQLTRMLNAAVQIGSPIVRAVLGNSEDRKPPGIEAHIEDTVRVLRNVRSRVMDSGLKIAIENHSGDMQARELKVLVEEAGKEFTGVCLDSGNPLWTIEDPLLTLETLYPYVLTSHIRDTAVWNVPEGAAVAWTRMGEGNVGIDSYVRKYCELCPGRALSLEIIVTAPRIFAYRQPGFWDRFRHTPAWEFERFVKLAEQGQPRPKAEPIPKGLIPQCQREDLEASIQYTKRLIHT